MLRGLNKGFDVVGVASSHPATCMTAAKVFGSECFPGSEIIVVGMSQQSGLGRTDA